MKKESVRFDVLVEIAAAIHIAELDADYFYALHEQSDHKLVDAMWQLRRDLRYIREYMEEHIPSILREYNGEG